MKVLITNDDGIDSPGLWELQRAISICATTIVVAPATEQSGRGASITLTGPTTASRLPSSPCEAYRELLRIAYALPSTLFHGQTL